MMLSFRDTRDFLLLSYDMELIEEEEFGLLSDTCSSLNLDLQNDSFPRFDMSQLNGDEYSVIFFKVSENRILLVAFFFSMSASFDKAEVI